MEHLRTKEEAIHFMDGLKAVCKEEVGIFTDGGWDIRRMEGRTIEVILDGNGQKPLATVEYAVFKELLNEGLIKQNSLITYKARSYHEYYRK